MVQEMIDLVGKPKTERLLIEADISPSMAGKLRRGNYDYEIGPIYRAAIGRALNAARALAKQEAS